MKYLFLAVDDALPLPGLLTPAMRETLIVFGAVSLVAGGLLFWASAIRKRRRRRSAPHRPHYARKSAGHSDGGEAGSRPVAHSHRRRRRWRERLPRNPTLAETGGLPPLRPEEPSGPPQSPAQP